MMPKDFELGSFVKVRFHDSVLYGEVVGWQIAGTIAGETFARTQQIDYINVRFTSAREVGLTSCTVYPENVDTVIKAHAKALVRRWHDGKAAIMVNTSPSGKVEISVEGTLHIITAEQWVDLPAI